MRRIARVAVLAADVGARFTREGIEHDPAAWLMAPRRLFGGGSAIFACQDRDNFIRGLLLHGLSLGLDADPGLIDVLLTEEASCSDTEEPMGGGGRKGGKPALYSAVVVEVSEGEVLLAFFATIAPSRAAFEDRLRIRLGTYEAALADVREGFEASEQVVRSLVPQALSDVLETIAADPSAADDGGIDVFHRQRLSHR
ncbi:hypothetical protein [Sphingomonas oligoaromativorans]|uniref:hypothetical protein n=1 Tax=Sphingomonas oligoaromativorans TaxID=575322 RepID=UPI0014204E28|nr:hypothetical protein [Sphingomonas oligoaromativorans]NIJ34179.1 hypothetical protein [Sphingomonas oligoaromativorans]